jgi:outer membrane protein OmpA-like peptidoglycan-associated protein
MFGGGVRFGWLRHWEIEVNARYGKFEATSLPAGKAFHNQTVAVEFDGVYSLKPDARWNPQIWAGLGSIFWQVVDVSGLSSAGMFADGPIARGYTANADPALLTDTNFAGNIGIGLEFNATSRLAFRIGVRSDWLWGNDADNTGASASHEPIPPVPPALPWTPAEAAAAQAEADANNKSAVDVNNFLPSALFRVTWFFADRDSDSDGIANNRDGCPYVAEDFDGYQDEDGCPDPDNDGDGVADVDDGCPDEAEDVDGFQDEDGCPDLDNDADGVPDASDQCPDEPEDIDGFQDTDGCPDLDDDADGVPDLNDQCPGTPAGIAVDSLGCPQVARIEVEFILTGVSFGSGKSELQTSSYEALDTVLRSLQAYPDVRLEVQGHTDSQGDPNKNFLLSQARAESVVSYLLSRGIDAGRLTPIGYGSDVPIAPNDTAAGREANRRVTLVPLVDSPIDPLAPQSGQDDDEYEDMDEDPDQDE